MTLTRLWKCSKQVLENVGKKHQVLSPECWFSGKADAKSLALSGLFMESCHFCAVPLNSMLLVLGFNLNLHDPGLVLECAVLS